MVLCYEVAAFCDLPLDFACAVDGVRKAGVVGALDAATEGHALELAFGLLGDEVGGLAFAVDELVLVGSDLP